MTEARRVTVISRARPAADTSPTALRVAPPGRAAAAPCAPRMGREARVALPLEAAKHDTFDEETLERHEQDERWHDDGHRRGHHQVPVCGLPFDLLDVFVDAEGEGKVVLGVQI